ncbi:MAG TPA: DUF1611 domain-containing protein, partial [Gemmatimonadales bacterium]|nr:DUF1611 domain-containing protein [Gemmatimonadales bacterium]
GYSGVTLGLLHGGCPDGLVLCHQASREYLGDYRRTSEFRIPPLAQYVQWYEELGGAVHATRVIGVSMNTFDLGEAAARDACARAADATGLPCTDPVRFDPAPLLDAVALGREAYLRGR